MSYTHDTASQGTESTVSPEVVGRALFNYTSGPEGRGVEIRKIHNKTVYTLYVDNDDAFVSNVADGSWGSDRGNTYFTINRLKDGVSARNQEQFQMGGQTTSDRDIERLIILPIDIDPERASGISATADELQDALDTGSQLIDFLRKQGWPEPVYAGISGNGGAAFYKINLVNTPANVALVKGVLEALDRRFSTDSVKIDASIYNPGRIMKVPGTMARKGSNTGKHPHRRATPGQINPDAGVVTAEQLAALGGKASPPGPKEPSNGQVPPQRKARPPKGNAKQDAMVALIEQACVERGITFKRKQGDRAVLITLDACLTSDAHDDGGFISVGPSGSWKYGCQHDSCQGRDPEERKTEAAKKLGIPLQVSDAEDLLVIADFIAYLPGHQYIYRPTRAMWPAASVNAVVPPVRVGTNTDGSALYQSASKWLDRHDAVTQMTWAPGQPEVIEGQVLNQGGWSPQSGARCFNQYLPPPPLEGEAAKAGPWVDHVRKVYPEDADHIIGWAAHRVQRPGEKINHALVLGGPPGIGKDTLLEPVRQAVGAWNVADASPNHITGRFNGFMKSVLLRISEARDLGEVDRYAFYEHTKTVIAAPPETVPIDEKFVSPYAIPNVTGVVFTTNNRTTGLHLPADDRRHYIAWSELTSDTFSADYWSDFYAWLAREGNGHVAAYLRDYDISTFDAKAPPPKTPAFWAIVDAGRSEEESELASVLEQLAWPDAVTLDQISERAGVTLSGWLSDRRNARQIPHHLERARYVRERNNAARDGYWVFSGKRRVIYTRLSLPRRERLAAARALAQSHGG